MQQHRCGSSAQYWLYVQKNDLLIRSSSGFAAHKSFRKAGIFIRSTSIKSRKAWCWHRLPSPCSVNRTRWGGGWGGKEKTTSPMIRNHRQVNVAPEPGCYLIRMKRRSGWGGGGGGWGRREGALLFGGEKKKREMPRLSQDCRIPCWRMSARASHTLIVDSTKTTWQQRRRLNPGHRAVFM